MRAQSLEQAGLSAFPSTGLTGDIQVPGDKSMSHRALILGALATGETIIEGLLESDDVLRTLDAVHALGARIDKRDDGSWRISGATWRTPVGPIDCGNSGTAARLLMGAAAGFPLVATFTGDESLRRRPMGRVAEPLAAMGARFDRHSSFPITLRGGGLRGIRYESPTPSAQVKSAILLAGLSTSEAVEVLEPIPSREHTEDLLKHLGCEVEIVDRSDGRLVRLGAARRLEGKRIVIPGDPSSAAFPIVAALITRGSEVTVRGLLDSPTRSGLLTTLLEMGADIQLTNRRLAGGSAVVDVTARSSDLKAVRVPKERAPSMIDEYPVLAVAAAFASGKTIMEGIGELRVKESDRLAAIMAGLELCGVAARSAGDSLRVYGCNGPPEGGALVRSELDHRIAMAFLTLGLGASKPVAVDDATMISTSFPDFVGLLRSLGAGIGSC